MTRFARHGHGSTRAVSTRAPSSSPNREGNVCDVTGSCEGALKGLSRMRGNSHVRFFGGRVDWQQSCGPATAPAYPSGPGQVSEVERIANRRRWLNHDRTTEQRSPARGWAQSARRTTLTQALKFGFSTSQHPSRK